MHDLDTFTGWRCHRDPSITVGTIFNIPTIFSLVYHTPVNAESILEDTD